MCPKQARLHPSTEQHIRSTVADVDQSAGKLALVKLAPEFPLPAALSLKIKFTDSTNGNKVNNIYYLHQHVIMHPLGAR